jgi:IS30 family transposase
MVTKPPLFLAYDSQLGGRLSEILATYQAAGHSPERIARLLYAEHGVEVSRMTIVRWLTYVDAPATPDSPAEAAS